MRGFKWKYLEKEGGDLREGACKVSLKQPYAAHMPSIALFPYAASTTSRKFLLDTTRTTTITRTSASIRIVIIVTSKNIDINHAKHTQEKCVLNSYVLIMQATLPKIRKN